MGCARKQTPSLAGFVCLEEYRLAELTAVYDSFVLHSPPAAASPPPLPMVTTAAAAAAPLAPPQPT